MRYTAKYAGEEVPTCSALSERKGNQRGGAQELAEKLGKLLFSSTHEQLPRRSHADSFRAASGRARRAHARGEGGRFAIESDQGQPG